MFKDELDVIFKRKNVTWDQSQPDEICKLSVLSTNRQTDGKRLGIMGLKAGPSSLE